MTMNSYLKKRKKSVFNNYKIVRTTINLNKANNQPLIAAHKTVIENKGWENNWIEQVAEMRTELNSTNQIVSKQNKLIIKWWEN